MSGFERQRQEADELWESLTDFARKVQSDPESQIPGQMQLPLGYYDHGDPDELG